MSVTCTQKRGFLIEDPEWLGRSISILRDSSDGRSRSIAAYLDAIRASVYYKPLESTVKVEVEVSTAAEAANV